jgi:hypothetical protein
MAKSLKLAVVAEGVSAAQIDLLGSLGCDGPGLPARSPTRCRDGRSAAQSVSNADSPVAPGDTSWTEILQANQRLGVSVEIH